MKMMNNLPEFLFCENKSALPGAGLILHTSPPYWIGQVIKFDNSIALNQFIDKQTSGDLKRGFFAWAKLLEYNIIIVLTGALGQFIVPEANGAAAICTGMADFYFDEKVKMSAKYYKRYKS